MKNLTLVAVLLLGIAATSAEAKRGWNGPDSHGINPEVTTQVQTDENQQKSQ